MHEERWGSRAWQEAHFPSQQLDSVGDTWGIRWRGVEKLRHASYLRLLTNVLKQPQPLHVLDIGCALCDFTSQAAAVNTANNFSVMDIAENAIAWVQQRFPAFQCQVAALPTIPFPPHFDVILCLEVLCYLEADDRNKAIQQIHNKLQSSGLLIFSGVLDNGERYHTEHEMINMIGEQFAIEHVAYNHWWLYKLLFETPLNRSYDILTALHQQLSLSAIELDTRYRDRQVVGKLLKVMRNARPLSTSLLSASLAPIRWLLSSRLPPELAQAVSSPIRGRRHADEIIIVARKK